MSNEENMKIKTNLYQIYKTYKLVFYHFSSSKII